MNEVIRQLMQHASVRRFNDTPISAEDERLIIGAAMRGATAGNMMSYSIIRIRIV